MERVSKSIEKSVDNKNSKFKLVKIQPKKIENSTVKEVRHEGKTCTTPNNNLLSSMRSNRFKKEEVILPNIKAYIGFNATKKDNNKSTNNLNNSHIISSCNKTFKESIKQNNTLYKSPIHENSNEANYNTNNNGSPPKILKEIKEDKKENTPDLIDIPIKKINRNKLASLSKGKMFNVSKLNFKLYST